MERFGEAGFLFPEQATLEPFSGHRQAQQALPPVIEARRLRDIAALDEVGQHAGQGLLGDAQDRQQLGYGNARMAADEMHGPVMGAPEAERRFDMSMFGSFDAAAFAIGMLVVVAASAAAAWFPSLRAARIEPVSTLRCD